MNLFNLILLCFFLVVVIASDSEGQEDGSSKVNDYAIYELIDKMRSLTPDKQSLYELLEVTPSATEEQISKSFRRISRQWHPDKNSSEEARSMYTLLSSVSSLLRSEAGRARYEWILHEAPPWHRSSVFLYRNFVASPKIGPLSVILLILLFLTVSQLIAAWVSYWVAVYWRWSANQSFQKLPAKEQRKLRERLARSNDPQMAAYMNDAIQNLVDATKDLPHRPRFRDLFIVALPIRILSLVFNYRRQRERPE